MNNTYNTAATKALSRRMGINSKSAYYGDVMDILFTDNPNLFTSVKTVEGRIDSKSYYTSNRELFETVKASVVNGDLFTFYDDPKDKDVIDSTVFRPLIITNNRVSDQFCKLFYSENIN